MNTLLMILWLLVPVGVWAQSPSDAAKSKECPRSADAQKAYQERLKTHPEKDPFQMTDEERRASAEQAIATAQTPENWRKHPPCEINQEDKDKAREMPGRPPTHEEMEKQKATPQ